jgi:putative DNA primase/helicase
LTPVDFKKLAADALVSAERLVPQWLAGGARQGPEWVALNPTRGDSKVGSFKVNLVSGRWSDFATGDSGGDLLSLYAYLFHGGRQIDAAKALAGPVAFVSASPSRPPVKKAAWEPILPIPIGPQVPATPMAHPVRGLPARRAVYRDLHGAVLGFVYRFVTSDGGKDDIPLVFARSREDSNRREWRWQQFAEPRPLYGLWDLGEFERPVLIVEGEKCRDAAAALLSVDFVCASWPGGANAIGKVDWSPLANRNVVIWPDADSQREKAIVDGELPPFKKFEDQPGVKAAEAIAKIVSGLGARVRIVNTALPGVLESGWDVADAIAAGWTRQQLLEFIARNRAPACELIGDANGGATAAKAVAKKTTRAKAARASGGGGGEDGGGPPGAGDGEPSEPKWSDAFHYRKGELTGSLANLSLVLLNHPQWAGVLAYDQFASRTKALKRPPSHQRFESSYWEDHDSSLVNIWMTNRYQLTASSALVDEAIEVAARGRSFHPVRDWLSGLPVWDGVHRLSMMLSDYLGVAESDYAKLVSKWWMMGLVMRVLRPGCQFDYCLVLEGAQGRRKSSWCRALVDDEWFSDTDLDLNNKDSMASIQGKWIHEFAEMGSLARAEATRQKSFLTRRIDEFRPAFGRRQVRCPRQTVFVGTTNEWTWNKDPTGGRRFWPVECSTQIDIDGMLKAREQLFAEALSCVKAGERCYPTVDEQSRLFDPEQLARESEDGFFDPIHDWLEHLAREEFSLYDVMSEALKLDSARQTRDVQTRCGQILKKLGCGRREKRNGVTRFVYTVPSWSRYASSTRQRVAEVEVMNRDGDVPI